MALDLSQPFPKNERLLPVPESLVDAVLKDMEEDAVCHDSEYGAGRSIEELNKMNFLSEAYYKLKKLRETNQTNK